MSLSELKQRSIETEVEFDAPWDRSVGVFPGEMAAEKLYEGARTGAFRAGVFVGDVWHNDVKSMYPSIMEMCNFSPENMRLVKLKPYTGQYSLTPTQIEAPDQTIGMQLVIEVGEEDSISRLKFGELKRLRAEYRAKDMESAQKGVKLVANAAYGYCGMRWAKYGNFLVAIATTAVGRLILDTIVADLNEAPDAYPLECDTDGVYSFGANRRDSFLPKVRALFSMYPNPEILSIDTVHYDGMICTGNKKNYVLLKGETITFTGNSLKGRGMPGCAQEALQVVAGALFRGEDPSDAYQGLLERLDAMPLSAFELSCNINRADYVDTTMYAKLLKQAPWMVQGEELRYVCVKRDGYKYAPLGSLDEDEMVVDHGYYKQRMRDAVDRLVSQGAFYERFVEKKRRSKK